MTKEELQQYMEIKREIKIIEEKIELLKSKKENVKSMIITDMPRCNSERDRLLELLGEIEELIGNYVQKEMELMSKQKKIEDVIDSLGDSLDRNIMRLRYLNNYTWERICFVMNFSWNGVHKRHKKILEQIKGR